jgi:hypothetical protein
MLKLEDLTTIDLVGNFSVNLISHVRPGELILTTQDDHDIKKRAVSAQ